jgi:hypothetical protein
MTFLEWLRILSIIENIKRGKGNMSDQIQSLIRTGFKLVAGFLVAKGIGDASAWDLVASGAAAAVGIVWSALVHSPAK